MPNTDLIHASICAACGAIGLLLVLIVLRRQSAVSSQPDWEHEDTGDFTDPGLAANAKSPQSKWTLGLMIALIAFTAVASVVTVALAYRS